MVVSLKELAECSQEPESETLETHDGVNSAQKEEQSVEEGTFLAAEEAGSWER